MRDDRLDSPFFCDGLGGLDRDVSTSPDKNRLSRRQVLTGGLLGAVWWAASKPALSEIAVSPDSHSDHTTVVVFLRGGADGLNLVVPYGDDDYYRRRPNLALSAPGRSSGSALKIDDFFGLHPSLAPLLPSIAEGECLCIHAVGSHDQSKSHFEASAAMERGLARDSHQASTGWIGRHLAASPRSGTPIRAVALSQTMPDSLVGGPNSVAVQSLSQLRLGVEASRYDDYIAALTKLYESADDDFAESGRNTLTVLKRLQDFDPRDSGNPITSLYPGNSLGEALSDVASLIKADIGLEFACVNMDGFDTHVTQGATVGWLPTLLDGLSTAIESFMKDIGPLKRRTTVLVMTEFGRRISENSGLGTDHGSGSCMFLLGGDVAGGRVLAEWPGLRIDDPENPGDLNVTTDYRRVLWELISRKHGATEVQAVFPNFNPAPVGLF